MLKKYKIAIITAVYVWFSKYMFDDVRLLFLVYGGYWVPGQCSAYWRWGGREVK